jgi:hypothetical protein
MSFGQMRLLLSLDIAVGSIGFSVALGKYMIPLVIVPIGKRPQNLCSRVVSLSIIKGPFHIWKKETAAQKKAA